MSETAAAALIEAEARAVAARAKLSDTLAATKQRIAPARLAADGRERVQVAGTRAAQGAVDEVRARPALYAGIAGAAVLLLLRRPIGALAARIARLRRAEPPAPPYPGDRPPASRN